MEGVNGHDNTNRNQVKSQANPSIVKLCVGYSDLTFRILVIGQDDVLPIMAQNIEKFMITHHRSIKVKVHLAMSLNEEIARKLSKDGLHAVLICSDPSKTMTASSIKETLRHLDFDLISLSLFCINVIRPSSITYEIVSEQTEQLSAAYHFTIVNISVEDEASLKSGIGRIMTSSLRNAGYLNHFVPMNINNNVTQPLDQTSF